MGLTLTTRLPLAFLALATAPLAFQGYRLSGPLPRTTLGSTTAFELSPTGDRVVFLADVDPDDPTFDLFIAPVDGGTPTRRLSAFEHPWPISSPGFNADGSRVLFLRSLPTTRLWSLPADGGPLAQISGPMRPGGAVRDYLAAPVGPWVVFRADKENGSVELYSVPADSAASPVKLNAPLATGGNVEEYRISPDGSHVVYRADQEVDERFDLYSAPIDGSAAPVRLNLTRPSADVERDFALSFDGLGVVYRADQDSDERVELYTVPIDGSSAPMKRNGQLQPSGDVLQFALSTVNDRLVYRADASTDEMFELFAIRAIAGGTPLQLNDPLPANGDVVDFRLSPDARAVVYLANHDRNDFELFGVPTSRTSAPVQLSSGENDSVTEFLFAAGGRLLYVKLAASVQHVYGVTVDGSQAPVELGPPERSSWAAVPSPDNTVLMLSKSEIGVVQLYGAPLDGSAPAERLSGPQASGGDVLEIRATLGGSYALYVLPREQSVVTELFSVPTSGGRVRRLSPPLPLDQAMGRVLAFDVSADGSRATYTAENPQTRIVDLFSVATDGSESASRLHAPLGLGSKALDSAFSPDGRRVAFRLARSDGSAGLYCADVTAGGSTVRLDAGESFRNVSRFTFLPDSSALVFAASSTYPQTEELFLVPSDGSSLPIRVHLPLFQTVSVTDLALTADGAWVVSTRSSPTTLRLYSVPLDGHLPPTRLNPRGNLGGSGWSHEYAWRFTPDESRVVYLADQDTDAVCELYVVPIDASQAPLKLNAPLVAGGNVSARVPGFHEDWPYLVSPDGTWVVYRADQEVDERDELYVVPLAGGPVRKLNGPLPSGGNVRRFALSADSSRTVYLANEENVDRFELWSVPLDGSAARVKLNGPLAAFDGVRDSTAVPFRVSRAGRVVYQQWKGGTVELWSTTVDGGSTPVPLYLPLAPDVGVSHFQFTADETEVVYASNRLGAFELFLVPADGSSSPRLLNGPMVPEGGVVPAPAAYLATANDLVLYLADQDTRFVPELYATRLDWNRGSRRSEPPSGLVTR